MNITQSIVTDSDSEPAVDLPLGEPLTLAEGISIESLGGADAIASRGNNAITINGLVSAAQSVGIVSGAEGGSAITVSDTGSVFGAFRGLVIGGFDTSSTVINYGEIASDETAIEFQTLFVSGGSVTNYGTIRGKAGISATFDSLAVINHGLIEAANTALSLGGTIENSGAIVGGSVAVQLLANNEVTTSLTNTGTVRSTAGVAIMGDYNLTVIVNRGLIEGIGTNAIDLAVGNDTYDGQFGRVVGRVLGGQGDDFLRGGAQVDKLFGGDDNDRLEGRGGADRLDGGSGNDKYVLNADPSDDMITDASGVDIAYSTVTRILIWDVIENLTLQGTANIDGTGNVVGNVITGNSGRNSLFGGGGNDTLSGGAEQDVLDGGAGDDTLIGGAGAGDTLKGGADNDTYILNDKYDNVIDTGGAADRISTSINRSLAGYGAIENLSLTGSGAIYGYGNALGNTIIGNSARNTLQGQAGADTLKGGLGTDSFYGQAGADRFVFESRMDTGHGSLRDIIYDLDDDGNDVIDLSKIPGLDTFINSDPFTATNQVRIQQVGNNVLVQIGGIGGAPPPEILLVNTTIGNGVGQVGADDFLL